MQLRATIPVVVEIRPTFRNHVGCIVALRAQKNVSWVTTGRVVAAMKSALAFGYRASRQYPSDPAGDFISPIPADNTMAVRSCCRCPRPALRRTKLFDLLPKSNFRRHVVPIVSDLRHSPVMRLASTLGSPPAFSSGQNVSVTHKLFNSAQRSGGVKFNV